MTQRAEKIIIRMLPFVFDFRNDFGKLEEDQIEIPLGAFILVDIVRIVFIDHAFYEVGQLRVFVHGDRGVERDAKRGDGLLLLLVQHKMNPVVDIFAAERAIELRRSFFEYDRAVGADVETVAVYRQKGFGADDKQNIVARAVRAVDAKAG